MRKVIAVDDQSGDDTEALCAQTGLLEFIKPVCKLLANVKSLTKDKEDQKSISYYYSLEITWILTNIAYGPDKIMS